MMEQIEYRLIVFTLITVLATFLLPKIPQSSAYHNFSDKRMFCGIPNCLNVASSLLFTIVGLLGVGASIKNNVNLKITFGNSNERGLYIIFFIGVVFIGLTSVYYHLDPNNVSLAWDRAAMASSFMTFLCILIGERINVRWGLGLLFPFIALGELSVLYWINGELQEDGDLKFYGWVQYYPIIAFLLIFWFYPSRYTHTIYFWKLAMWSVLGKITELSDHQIFHITYGIISGHTLKHVFFALAVYNLVLYLRNRHLIESFDA